MANQQALGPPTAQTAKAARAAGIRRDKLSFSDIDRRRTQLWSTSVFLIVAVTVTIALVYLGGDFIPDELRMFQDLSSWVVVVLVGGLALAFLVYVLEKELSLRRLTDLLVEERVLSAALSNRLAEISALSEVGKAINTTLDLEDVLDMILSSSLELLGGTEGSVMLLTEDRMHLEVVSYRGPQIQPVIGGRRRLGEGISGTVAQSRTPILIEGSPSDERFTGHPERGIRSSMCVPLIRRDELMGVLNLNETRGERSFTEQDLDALGLFAEHAAIAIGNAAMFEQERETIHRLEDLDRLKSDFVATVSHELKTPLTAIIGSATTLSKRAHRLTPEQQATFIEMIERQGQRLLRLVEDILTTAQIESGMPKLRRELVDLREAAGIIIDDLRHSHSTREVTLTCEPERPHLWGDMGAIQQILSNLIENALKYSDKGKIGVHVKETPTETIMQVSDEGRGISREQLTTVFDRFRQVDQSSTRGKGGFGLGLYIVKSLIESHNGHIEVESEEGRGSTFTVIFPKRSRDTERALLKSPDATPDPPPVPPS